VLLFLGYRIGLAVAIANNDEVAGLRWLMISFLIGLVWLIATINGAIKRRRRTGGTRNTEAPLETS
jgi:hypothetical protein